MTKISRYFLLFASITRGYWESRRRFIPIASRVTALKLGTGETLKRKENANANDILDNDSSCRRAEILT